MLNMEDLEERLLVQVRQLPHRVRTVHGHGKRLQLLQALADSDRQLFLREQEDTTEHARAHTHTHTPSEREGDSKRATRDAYTCKNMADIKSVFASASRPNLIRSPRLSLNSGFLAASHKTRDGCG